MNMRLTRLILGFVLVTVLGLPHTSWTKNNLEKPSPAQTLTTSARRTNPQVGPRASRQDASSYRSGTRSTQRVTPNRQSLQTYRSSHAPREVQGKQDHRVPSQSGQARAQSSRFQPKDKKPAPPAQIDRRSGFQNKSTPNRSSRQGAPKVSTPKKRDTPKHNSQVVHQNPKHSPRKITPQNRGTRPRFHSPARPSVPARPHLGRKSIQVRHVYHHLPSRHDVFTHKNRRYHFHHGRYYGLTSFGFILVRPPIGLMVFNLPLGFHTVISAGVTYYVHNDIYYRRVPTGYEVVKPVRVVTQDYPEQVVVHMDVLNVRYGPSQDEEIIAQISLGTVLNVLGAAPGWLYIEIPDEDIQGWVMRDYVRDLEAGQLTVGAL